MSQPQRTKTRRRKRSESALSPRSAILKKHKVTASDSDTDTEYQSASDSTLQEDISTVQESSVSVISALSAEAAVTALISTVKDNSINTISEDKTSEWTMASISESDIERIATRVKDLMMATLKSEIKALITAETKSIVTELKVVKEENKFQRKQCVDLEIKMDELEQYSRDLAYASIMS